MRRPPIDQKYPYIALTCGRHRGPTISTTENMKYMSQLKFYLPMYGVFAQPMTKVPPKYGAEKKPAKNLETMSS